ncbi:MAG: response regulator transcription factor [Ignavibacteria bacterium]|nr:response regulator transcription factor [Ignavibacteria bacterium]MCU7505173.1 response regulator transcription factor [Ignavibacteria bacterium]MCU7518392.1 response regulator transcription factor [Ignavibacteria bacterium]
MRKILVVEDDKMLLSLIMEILENNGFRPEGAENGKEALDLFYRHGADLIICDVLMPMMNGYELLQEIRKSAQGYVPFILLTGKSERADFRKGMELGADDFIPKPFSEEELLGAVLAQLKKWNSFGFAQFQEKMGYSEITVRQEVPMRTLGLDDRILLSVDNQPKILKINDLKCISALGDYTNVFTSEGKFIVRRSMKEWEELLPAKFFIRIHRSTIINLDFVSKIEKLFNRSYKVYLQNIPKPFIISRRYGNKFKEKFS